MARPDPNAVQIGSLRWPILICRREEIPDPNSTGFLEVIENGRKARADIQPTGPMTFYAAEQVNTPITHRITLRYLDWIDTTFVIFRRTICPDKSVSLERFRIRRSMDIDGRKRFTRCECELEERR